MEILLVEDEKSLAITLADQLEELGHQVMVLYRGDAALAAMSEQNFDLVVTDCRLPGADGIEVLERARLLDPPADAVVMTGYATVDQAVDAMRGGAFSYLQKPFPIAALESLVTKIDELRSMRRELEQLRAQSSDLSYDRLVGSSASMTGLRSRLEKVAAGDAPVLLVGESGTGKGLAAKFLHCNSDLASEVMVPVACGAIPANLLEGELYGYRKGAFTGAEEDRSGLLAHVGRGILFLDDVDDLPLAAQASFLRVLQEREFMPLGSSKPQPFLGRIVAASKQDLVELVRAGLFREDLYYRLEVLTVELPPLREHLDDLPELVAHFLQDADPLGKRDVPTATLGALRDHDWPGNVRELENSVKRAVALCGRAKLLRREHFLPGGPLAATVIRRTDMPSLGETVRLAEREAIRAALAASNGKRVEAAEILGISRKALWQKSRELGL